ncbi:MAG: type II toxin-antitoxin system VapC family toxin [Acetobacteraceae bacterium]
MNGFVVDASIAVKWVIDEPGTEFALALRRRRLVAPDLLGAECANILWKKAHRGEITPEEAALAAGLLSRAEIELRPMRSLMPAAMALSLALDHPAYYCLYLALAEATAFPFVTADARLLSRIARDHACNFSGQALALADAAASIAHERD